MLRISPNGKLPMAPSGPAGAPPGAAPMPPGMPPPPDGGGALPPGLPPELLAAAAQGGPTKYDSEKVKPEVARYLSSDQGPFECQNCHHFDGQGGCEVVSGPIDPKGVCCLFESVGAPDVQDETDVPASGPANPAGAPPPDLPPNG
jgi:hypothetical protein